MHIINNEGIKADACKSAKSALPPLNLKLSLATLAIILLSNSLFFHTLASADALIPPQNDFYADHYDEVTYVSRSFFVNGEDGYIALAAEPGSTDVIKYITNGEIIVIFAEYTAGNQAWGVTRLTGAEKDGWVLMSQLVLAYDYMSFYEDHQDEFYPYAGSYDEVYANTEIMVYEWPGSGEAVATISGEDLGEGFVFRHAYLDPQGNEWAFIDYWQGIRNSWICLSDLSNDKLPATNPRPQVDLIPAQEPQIKNPTRPSGVLIFTIVAVILLITVTALLIRRFMRGR
ncbi:MAG: hypothetical protein FWH40_00255 [Coriobacteriia bacterium]|nr:hypothetical protein [Coriobacteriia bacterium]